MSSDCVLTILLHISAYVRKYQVGRGKMFRQFWNSVSTAQLQFDLTVWQSSYEAIYVLRLSKSRISSNWQNLYTLNKHYLGIFKCITTCTNRYLLVALD